MASAVSAFTNEALNVSYTMFRGSLAKSWANTLNKSGHCIVISVANDRINGLVGFCLRTKINRRKQGPIW